jgi:HPt (histidine-containing phosphotransfer) domain-containing protein
MNVIDNQSFNDSFQYFDKEIVVEILDIFLNEYEDRLSTIKKSIDEVDFPNLKFHAHSLKGVVANFAAPSAQAAAKALEDKGTNSINDGLLEDYENLKEIILKLVKEIKVLREDFV